MQVPILGKQTIEKQNLNFEVIGGTTQPTNPKENTIWVETSNEITGWGFGAEEYMPTSPTEGMIWIVSINTSPANFNALTENSIIISIRDAYQCISGSWVKFNMKIYQGNQWVTTGFVVLKDGAYGDTYFATMNSGTSDRGILSDGSGRSFYKGSDSGWGTLRLRTYDKIPKEINKLEITARLIESPLSDDRFYMSTESSESSSYNNQIASLSPFTGESQTNTTFTFDLSNVTEDAYLWYVSSTGLYGEQVHLVIKDIIEV